MYRNPNPNPRPNSSYPNASIIEALTMSLTLKRRWGLVLTGRLRQGLRRSLNTGGSYSTAGGDDIDGKGGSHSDRGNESVHKASGFSMCGVFGPRGSVLGVVGSRGPVWGMVGSRGSVSGVISRCYGGKKDSGGEGGESEGGGERGSSSEEKMGMTQQRKKGVAVASPGGKVPRLARLEAELNAELDAEQGLKDPEGIWKRMGMMNEEAGDGRGDGAGKRPEKSRRKGGVAEQTWKRPLEDPRVKGIKTVLGLSNEYPPIELSPEDYDFTDFTDLATRPPRMPTETDSKVRFLCFFIGLEFICEVYGG